MFAWVCELAKQGHAFQIIGPEGSIRRICEENHLEFTPFQPAWWTVELAALNRFALLRSLLASRYAHGNLVQHIRRFQPDWIYSNSGVLPLGWILSQRLRIRHAWHLREFLDLDFGFRFALGAHFTRSAFASADRTISVSKAVQKHLCPQPSPRNVVVYEGIARAAQLQARAEQGKTYPPVSPTTPFRFVLVGMLQVNKGQELAIRALAELRNNGAEARLILVGGGVDTPFRALAASLGVEPWVEFTGHTSDPAPIVLSCHASLMCSRAEAFGRTTIEAMSLGRPIIALNRGASPELIIDGETGLLCDATPQALSASMQRLIQSPENAAAIGRRAAAASQQFSNENYAAAMLRTLSGPIDSHQP